MYIVFVAHEIRPLLPAAESYKNGSKPPYSTKQIQVEILQHSPTKDALENPSEMYDKMYDKDLRKGFLPPFPGRALSPTAPSGFPSPQQQSPQRAVVTNALCPSSTTTRERPREQNPSLEREADTSPPPDIESSRQRIAAESLENPSERNITHSPSPGKRSASTSSTVGDKRGGCKDSDYGAKSSNAGKG